MQNKRFVITSVALAIVANCAIIGCNRQSSDKSKSDDSMSLVPAAHAEPVAQQQVPVPAQTPAAETNRPASSKPSPEQKNPYEKADIEVKVFRVDPPATGYGYDIIIDHNAKGGIHQYNIPG